MFKTILFPVDQSRESREAAVTVLNLVNTYSSHLVILGVVETGDKDMGSQEAVKQLLEDAQTLFSQEGITAEIVEREGMPSFTICDVADEINADLIIMGSRGLGLTDQGASDSVTAKVINLSPCPVLVVP